jgi:hypothetical protein
LQGCHRGRRCEGRVSAVFSAKTDGYLEYEGLGWSSHLVLPKDAIFTFDLGASEHSDISDHEIMHSGMIPAVNKETYVKVQDDKESIQLISLNGIVFASKLGKRGVSLGPIFDQITKTGDFATSMMEKLLGEMARGELQMNLMALQNSSKQAIDLIDRNLFERSADIRWWATDQFFWKALEEPTDEAFDEASKRLKVINSSYTMYRNLVLADNQGNIDSPFKEGCAPFGSPIRRLRLLAASVGVRGLWPRFRRACGPFLAKTTSLSAGRPAQLGRAPDAVCTDSWIFEGPVK